MPDGQSARTQAPGSRSTSRGGGFRRAGPNRLLTTLRSESARDVASRLFDQPGRWSAVLDGIGSGQDPWLDAAFLLRPGSDAHSAEELTMAIQEAFVRAPSREILVAEWRRRRAIAERLAGSPPHVRTKCLAALDDIKRYYAESSP